MTEPITIRRAKVEEVEGIAACLASAFESFRARYTPDAFGDTVLKPEAIPERMLSLTVYAAISNDGEVVGTISSAIEGEEGHLRGIAVLPAWQGCSVAEQLLRRAEKDLIAAGCVRVTLDTTVALERAIRFYRKNGFVPSGKVTDFCGMPLHEYVKSLVV